MKKKIIIFSSLIVLILLSSCGILNNASGNTGTNAQKIETYVDILDEYGNKIFVEGKINGFQIVLKDGETGISQKLSEIKNVELDTEMFDYDFKFEDGRVVINLHKKDKLSKNTVELQKDLSGNIIVYTYEVEAPRLNIWLDEMLSNYWMKDKANLLEHKDNVIAGNYLISIINTDPIGTTFIRTGASGNVNIKRIQLKDWNEDLE